MAVTVIKNPSALRMKFDCGKDDDGKVIRKTKTYGSLNPTADPQNVYDVAVLFAALQNHALMQIEKVDYNTIGE